MSILATVSTWVLANVWPLVAGFVARHFSQPILAAGKSALAWGHNKVQSALAWVHSKLP